MGKLNNKEKFTNKVEEYVKYRPTYPKEFINYLIKEVGISTDAIIADVGAGTGIFTKLLGSIVKTVYAVEPNLNMRTACEKYCEEFEGFKFIDGSAENTTLADNSIDFITVAQAFHWFDQEKTKIEFQRILKPKGKVILVWNSRVPEIELTKENDQLFRKLCPDFTGFSGGVDLSPEAYHKDFFKNSSCEYRVFNNDRVLSLEGFIGGSLSSSYAPLKGDINYIPFIDGLTELFNKYSSNGKLIVQFNTHSYVGEL